MLPVALTVSEASMKAPSLLASLLTAVALIPAACSDTPTESSSVLTTGSLVISITQACPFPGSVTVLAGSTRLGALVVPGQTTFSIPAGSYALSFVRGQETFGASGLVQVPAGGAVVVTDPPAACMSTTGAP
jgi:hypothetical protein